MQGSNINKKIIWSTPLILLTLALLMRALSLGYPDLIDPTETRYAVIAQEMVIHDNWVTPMLPYGREIQPYLGKPPLHFWLTAISYKIFGFEEWSSRLPSFLALSFIILGIIFIGPKSYNQSTKILAALITISSALMFFFSGASVVDVTLTATISLALLCFNAFFETESRRAKYLTGILFFLFSALSFITKGLIGPVLIGVPIFGWCALGQRFGVLKKLPWGTGLLITGIVTIPWLYLAELRNPGFLRYFIINEHFQRYLVHDYGDRYGTGHVYPRGSSWWMLFTAYLPWSFALLYLIYKHRSLLNKQIVSKIAPHTLLLILWAITPPLFFTVAKQLIASYILPSIPALALLTAIGLSELTTESVNYRRALRRINIVLTLIACGISAAGLARNYGIDTLLLSVLIIAILLYGLFFRKIAASSIEQFSLLATASVAIYILVIINGRFEVAQGKSTEDILTYIASKTLESEPVIGVIMGNHYSHCWLENAWANELPKKIHESHIAVSDISTTNIRNLIMKKKDLNKLTPELRNQIRLRRVIGAWAWATVKRNKPNLSQAALHGYVLPAAASHLPKKARPS